MEEKERILMRTVVVFDGGYGGELFAEKLKEELDVVEVIRVIDWRNADKLLYNARTARRVAREALRPYIGRVDLVVLANHYLTITSLRHFRRKYRNQKFIGFGLKQPRTLEKYETLILTTKAVKKTINFYNYLMRLKRSTCVVTLDDWLSKIDDGELELAEIKETLQKHLRGFRPREVVLACAQFSDIKHEIRRALGWNITIYDSFDDAIRQTGKALGLRGGVGKAS